MKEPIHPLISLTNQEIFDRAYLGIKSQKWEPSVDALGRCMYQSSLGQSCVIGQVCKGGRYPAEWTSPDSEGFWESLGIEADQVDDKRKRFLQALQSQGHDHPARRGESLRVALESFAHGEGLQIPPLE